MAPKKVMKAMKAVKKTRRNKVAHGEPLWIEEDLFGEDEHVEEPLWIEEDLFGEDEHVDEAGTSSAGTSSNTMHIWIKCLINEMVRLEVKPTDTIGVVKAKIHAEIGLPIERQALWGRYVLLLYNDSTLADLRVENNEIFECRDMFVPTPATTPTPVTTL
jgi:hypothetical protein